MNILSAILAAHANFRKVTKDESAENRMYHLHTYDFTAQ